MDTTRKVVEGKLYRSSRPGYPKQQVSQQAVNQWIEKARQQGIRSILCLLSEDELRYYTDLPRGLLGAYQEAGFTVRHLPLPHPNGDGRGAEELERALGAIGDAYDQLPKPVLVHCDAGQNRTGRAVTYLTGWRESRRE